MNALQQYLVNAGITADDFAASIGRAPSTIWRQVRGERGPTFAVALDVERGTKGKVSADEFMSLCIDARPGRSREEWRKKQTHWKRREENETPRRKMLESINVGDPGLRLDGSLKSVSTSAKYVGKALDRDFKCATHPITRQVIVWRLR